jgi:hypothetical protein
MQFTAPGETLPRRKAMLLITNKKGLIMNGKKCTAMVLLFIVALFVLTSNSFADSRLRYNGVYRSAKAATTTSGNVWKYLRFYSDGTVIEVTSLGEPEQIWKWFSKGHPHISAGKFMIEGNTLSFSTASAQGTVDFNGQIDGDQLHLDIYSHINQFRETSNYVFFKMSESHVLEGDLNSELLSLAVSDNPDKIASIIDKGANIESKDRWGETALILSAGNGKVENVKILLEKGADINAVSGSKTTALMRAAAKGNKHVVEELIKSGADLNRKNIKGFTALMMAAGEANYETVILLIKKRVDVNSKNDIGQTALDLAKKGRSMSSSPELYIKKNRYDLIITWLKNAGAV